jgi:hypothetical protein
MPEAGYAVRPPRSGRFVHAPARRHPRYAARVLGRTGPDPGARGGGAGAATAWTLPAPAGHPLDGLAWLHVSTAYLLPAHALLERRGLSAHRPVPGSAGPAAHRPPTRRAGLPPLRPRRCALRSELPAAAAGPARDTAATDAPPGGRPETSRPPAPRSGQRPARGEGQPLPPDFTPSEDMLELLERFHGVPRAFALQQLEDFTSTGANAAAPATPGRTSSNSMYNSTGPDTSRNKRRGEHMEERGTGGQRVARGIAASSTTSRTPPGPTEATAPADGPATLVEAINQVFALFRLNYHNQYYAAFSDAEQLRQIKKLWLESLRDYPPAQVLQGARLAIESSEYLPTLHRMRSCCEESLPASACPRRGMPISRPVQRVTARRGPGLVPRPVYWAGATAAGRSSPRRRRARAGRASRPPTRRRCGEALGSAGHRLAPVPEAHRQGPWTAAPCHRRRRAAKSRLRRLREENDL